MELPVLRVSCMWDVNSERPVANNVDVAALRLVIVIAGGCCHTVPVHGVLVLCFIVLRVTYYYYLLHTNTTITAN